MQLARAFGAVAFTGVVGLIALKLLGAMLIPLLGMFFGALALAFKVALFLAVGFFLYRMFRRRRDQTAV